MTKSKINLVFTTNNNSVSAKNEYIRMVHVTLLLFFFCYLFKHYRLVDINNTEQCSGDQT